MDETLIYHELGKDPLFKVWHASEKAMFIYMHSEGGSIVCKEKNYPIKKGVLCFVGARKYHYTMPDNPITYDRSKLFVSPEKISRILDFLPDRDNFCDFTGDAFIYAQIDEADMNAVEEIFKEIKTHEKDEMYEELILISSLVKLLVFIDKYSLESTPSVSGIMSKAVEYINNNIYTDIDIDEICSAVHISKYHLCRQFKKITGMTIMNYILKTRIVMAQNMLLKERTSVTEISNCCGFSSISYFCRVFKEETGMTPLNYRKKGYMEC